MTPCLTRLSPVHRWTCRHEKVLEHIVVSDNLRVYTLALIYSESLVGELSRTIPSTSLPEKSASVWKLGTGTL